MFSFIFESKNQLWVFKIDFGMLKGVRLEFWLYNIFMDLAKSRMFALKNITIFNFLKVECTT
jgi:hypothetical protein